MGVAVSGSDTVSSPSPARVAVLQAVASAVPAPRGATCVRVGVDGPDGAGKTIFAAELAAVLRVQGRAVVRVSADDFHQVRALRYRRGRDSPEGFWLDSYDYGRLRTDVLEPLGPGGSRRYRPAAHDLLTDEVLEPPWRTAEPGSVLLLDGLFLHRAELAGCWDVTVFLDVPYTETAARMALRDGTPADPEHRGMRRYVGAQLLYAAAARPRERATVLIDNTDVRAPRILRAAIP